MELVDVIADRLVASGLCTGRYSTSGISVQVEQRRDLPNADTIVLLSSRGGANGQRGQSELPTFQCLIDSKTVSGAATTARAIHDHLHELCNVVLSGISVLYVRAVAPPQSIPHGPGNTDRFTYSLNFDAFIRKAGEH
jgi:hypothetical protein